MVASATTTGAKVIRVQEDTEILIPASNDDQPQKQSHPSCLASVLLVICLVLPWGLGISRLVGITLALFLPPKGLAPEFQVHSATLQYPHNATRSSSELTATWDLTLIATNPDMKWDIYCDSFHTMLFYGPGYRDQLTGVAATSLNPFYLTSSNQTSVSFKLSMLSAYVGNDMVKDILDGNTTTLSLRFGLVLSVRYSYRAHCSNMETPKPVSTTYFCNQIQVRDFGTGNMSTTTDHQPTACERS